jgi:hypothetical protein
MPRILDARALIRFSAIGAALYFALFLVGVASGAAVALEQGFASTATRAMDLLSPARVTRRVEVARAEQSTVQIEYRYRVWVEDREHSIGARYHLHAHNLALFAALALALPGLTGRARLTALGLGSLGVFLLDAVFVMGDLWRVEYLHLPEASEANTFRPARWIAAHLWRFHPTGSVFFAPVFMLGLLLPLRGRRARAQPATARARPAARTRQVRSGR